MHFTEAKLALRRFSEEVAEPDRQANDASACKKAQIPCFEEMLEQLMCAGAGMESWASRWIHSL